MQVHRAVEEDVGVVAGVGGPVEVDVRATLDGNPAHDRNRAQVDLPAVDRQVGGLNRAAHRALQVHGTRVRIERQPLPLLVRARRVDRAGEGDVAVVVVGVLVAFDGHVRVQVDRAGEGDVAVVAVIGGPVEVDIRARDRDRARRRHRVQVDLPAIHRQARQRRRAAHRPGERDRTGPRRHRQGVAAVDRRIERDVARARAGAHRRRRAQGHRAVEIDVPRRRHVPAEADPAAPRDREARQRRRAADYPGERHRAAPRRHRQGVAAVDRRIECDVARARAGAHRRRRAQGHRAVEIDVPRRLHVPAEADPAAPRDREAGQRRLCRGAHRPGERHRAGPRRHCQGPGPVNRRAEQNVARARTAAHRHRRAQEHRVAEGDGAAASRDVRTQPRPSGGIELDRGAAGEGQRLADCDVGRRNRTAGRVGARRARGRRAEDDGAGGHEPLEFRGGQNAAAYDSQRDVGPRRRDVDVARAGVDAGFAAGRGGDDEAHADQRDAAAVGGDGDAVADGQRAGAVGGAAGGPRRIRLENEAVLAVRAGDVGVDLEMAPRLQVEGAVRGAAPVDGGADRDVPRRLQGDVRVDGLERRGLDAEVFGCRAVAEIDHVVRGVCARQLAVVVSIGIGNRDIPRVQQQLADDAVGCAQVNRGRVELQMLQARHLDKAPVAGIVAAAGGEGPGEAGYPVRPDDHPAAVPACARIGPDDGVLADHGVVGVAFRPLSLEIPADQDLAAAGVSGCIDRGLSNHSDLLAQHLDATSSLAAPAAGCVERARYPDDALARPLQHDLAVALYRRARFDDTLHVDGVIHHVLGHANRQQHHGSAVGADGAAVADQRLQLGSVGGKQAFRHAVVDRQLNQAVAMEVKREGIARCQRNMAEPGVNHPAVLDPRRDKRDQAALGRGDPAAVDHRAARIAARIEAETAGLEVLVGDIVRRRDQAPDIDPCRLAEQDAVGVDEHDPAVGGELPENVGVFVAPDPVQRNRGRRRLLEVRMLVCVDRERTPIDDGLVGLLDDVEAVRRTLHDVGLAGNHPAAYRSRLRRLPGHQRAEQQCQRPAELQRLA